MFGTDFVEFYNFSSLAHVLGLIAAWRKACHFDKLEPGSVGVLTWSKIEKALEPLKGLKEDSPLPRHFQALMEELHRHVTFFKLVCDHGQLNYLLCSAVCRGQPEE